MKPKNRILLVAVVGLLLLGVAGTAGAQSNRSWDWTHWDVTINGVNTTQNVFHVLETQQITVTEGSFAGGDRSVTLDRVTSIDNVKVTQDGTALPFNQATSADSCTQPGVYCLLYDYTGNQYGVDIYYNFTQRTYAGQSHTMTLEYDVHGALRSYKEGDQLWWSPLAGSRDFSVLASRVVVQMPAGLQMLPDDNTSSNWTRQVEGSTVTFVAKGTIGGGDLAEISVVYTHDPNMAPPPWQADFDRTAGLKPIVSLGLVVLTILFAIGGPLLIFIYYSTHGRDPKPVVVPEYLTEPPSDLPPGVTGTLIDESADMQDIMATMLDLARRGYIVIEQIDHPGLFSHSLDFVFHRTDPAQTTDTAATPPVPLRRYEMMFLDGLFRGSSTTRLSELRNRFYRVIPGLKSQLYYEVVKAGYYPRSPETTRNMWMIMGIFLAGVSGFLIYVLLSDTGAGLRQLSGLFPLPFGALCFTGIVAIIAGQYMPAKTASGSQEAAKWRAFKHYLGNIKKYTKLEQATDQFEKYIGYAVAFGLDSHWMREFAPVLTSMPNWYYIDGYSHHRHWIGSSGRGGGDIFSGGGRPGSGGGLNEMSGNMTQGLNAMSSGLTSLLNSASSVMTSQPSSSGSGGGSHGGGGGGGGGGHAGGH